MAPHPHRLPPHLLPNALRLSYARSEIRLGHQSQRTGNESREGRRTAEKDTGHQGSEGGERGEGAVRKDGGEDASEAGGESEKEGEEEQIVEVLGTRNHFLKYENVAWRWE